MVVGVAPVIWSPLPEIVGSRAYVPSREEDSREPAFGPKWDNSNVDSPSISGLNDQSKSSAIRMMSIYLLPVR